MSYVIRESNDVRGITIDDTQIKLLQYADDTTVYLDEDKSSLKCVMDIYAAMVQQNIRFRQK